MSGKERELDYASAQDLAGLASGEIEVSLKTVPGKKIKIRRATIGEIADVLKVAKDSDLEQSFWLTMRCLVEPRLTLEQIKALPPKTLIEIGNHIARYSGIDKKSMDEVSNLLGIES